VRLKHQHNVVNKLCRISNSLAAETIRLSSK